MIYVVQILVILNECSHETNFEYWDEVRVGCTLQNQLKWEHDCENDGRRSWTHG